MRIGITGGAGFIGTNLARRLLRNGHEISVLDDFSTGLESNVSSLDLQVFRGSLEEPDLVRRFVDAVDKIVHLGARGSVPRSIKNPRATHSVNVGGTLELLEAARIEKKSMIFSSSSSVYGANPVLPKEETQWTLPMTPYAASKLSGEAFCSAYSQSYDFNVLVFRFFNVFGPWQRPDHDYAAVLPKWIWAAMNDQPIIIHGDGEQTRDFTYVGTVLDVLEKAVINDVRHVGPVNLAFGNRISLVDALGLLKNHFPNLKVEHVDTRPGDVRNSQNDATLLRSLFPDVKPVPFEIALNETIEWLKAESAQIVNGPAVLD